MEDQERNKVGQVPDGGDGESPKAPVPVKLDRRSALALMVVAALFVFGLVSTVADWMNPQRGEEPVLGESVRKLKESFEEEFPFATDSLLRPRTDSLPAGPEAPGGEEEGEGEKTDLK